MKIYQILWLTLALMFLAGCTTRSNYSLVTRNVGEKRIEGVMLEFGSGYFRSGTLISNAQKVLSTPGYKIPEEATLTWMNGEQKVTASVEVRKHIEKGFNGRIIFDIQSDLNEVSLFLWTFPGEGPQPPRPGQPDYEIRATGKGLTAQIKAE